jgi:hypothetical protein
MKISHEISQISQNFTENFTAILAQNSMDFPDLTKFEPNY